MDKRPVDAAQPIKSEEQVLSWFVSPSDDTSISSSALLILQETLAQHTQEMQEMSALFKRQVQELLTITTSRDLLDLPTDHQIRLRWQQISAQFPRIQVNPSVMNGEPCIAGTRVPVSVVLGCLADGYSPQEVIEEFGNLIHDDVNEALLFAARLTWLD